MEIAKLQAENTGLRRDIGRIEEQANIDRASAREQMAALRDEFRSTIAPMAAELHAMNITLSEARGGWKTLVVVGALAGSIGAGIAWVAGLFVGKH